MSDWYGKKLKSALSLLALALFCTGCATPATLTAQYQPNTVENAYNSSNVVQIPQYYRTIFSTHNF